MFQEFEEASQKAISTKDNIYCLSAPLTWKCLRFRVDQEICELLLFRNDREISGRDCRHEGEL